jgi:hypothetical protein
MYPRRRYLRQCRAGLGPPAPDRKSSRASFSRRVLPAVRSAVLQFGCRH